MQLKMLSYKVPGVSRLQNYSNGGGDIFTGAMALGKGPQKVTTIFLLYVFPLPTVIKVNMANEKYHI